jgi:hypothetical protein
MKCPRCWAHKAYVRRAPGWKGLLWACLLLRPMRCHHCYHKFLIPWPLTIGQQLEPPPVRIADVDRPGSARPSESRSRGDGSFGERERAGRGVPRRKAA